MVAQFATEFVATVLLHNISNKKKKGMPLKDKKQFTARTLVFPSLATDLHQKVGTSPKLADGP